MPFLFYILTYPLIWLFSKLPLRVLYVFSDAFYVIIYYLIPYRKKVVMDNLRLSFPDKSKAELKQISKNFFKHFVDVFIESVKSLSISKKEIIKRYQFTNPEIINNLAKSGKSIAFMGSHYASWEWITTLPMAVDIDVYGAYTKLDNPYFEKAVKKSRSRFGMIGIKTSDLIKNMLSNYKLGKQGLYILLSDQSPQIKKAYYWTHFLGVKVPVHTGAEMLAKKFDLAVVNFSCVKIKRGYYEVTFELITGKPKSFENYQIIDKYLAITEAQIRKQPEYYLWTHKRFKHMGKEPAKD